MKRPRVEVDLKELDELIDRATVEPMKPSDAGKIKRALHAMADSLSWRTSEKKRAVFPGAEGQTEAAAGGAEKKGAAAAKAKGHGRTPASEYAGAERVTVKHPGLRHGDPCPSCPKGKVYRQRQAKVLVRIVGQTPLAATVYELERLRCNACGEVFTAPEPEQAGEEKFDPSAPAMIAQLKYGSGMPWARLEALEKMSGIPLPAATQWDLMARGAESLEPVWEELVRQAAQGEVFHNDDTAMRVLRLARPDGDERTGVFTSGVVSVGSYRVALFFTGRQHAGENFGDVLRKRAAGQPPPIQMSDALSRNKPSQAAVELLEAFCLAHGRRQFVDVAENFPAECLYVLEALGQVYAHDAQARQSGMTPVERLEWHQQRSGPLMEELRSWCQRQLDEHLVEPNSGLGKAIAYMLNHWDGLTLFLRQPGAPLDNNLCERALKRAVLHRKNALFYRTQRGADAGDVFMSLIHTCALNAVNSFHYLTELLRHAGAAAADPARWMPWNYREAVNSIG